MMITSTDEELIVDGIPVGARLHQPSGSAKSTAPVVLHVHGGCFVGGSAAEADGIARLIAEAGAHVLSADYPLAPRHPFPQALEHLFMVLKMLDRLRGRIGRRSSRLVVAGEEAGGNLAAALALVTRDRQGPQLAGQILVGPMLDPCLGTRSLRMADAGPVGCCWADGWDAYLGAPERAAHPYAAPSNASRLGGVAPALLVTAADDPMRDECQAYAERLRQAGVPARQEEFAAPTGWPSSLRAPSLTAAPFADRLRESFVEFFKSIVPTPRRSAAAAGA
ncbi:alpha/beta hydrolase fold domain-containing protein [Chelatococcus reniformis]|uniref:Esterase n=1 Tax=Chelatococcus reniformis TaxID=1494448 RepID=A0A916XB87_9HYPH|nr:alpha/beta hydrolase fold domain-containing protein [Chelatococcus reniformis]GGC58896.1 esterase [Chelatococcus reniformis]